MSAFWLSAPALLAQGGAPNVANVSFLRLFGKQNFSAKAQLDMLDETGKNLMTVEEMNMVFLDGNFRADVNMANIKGPGLAEEEIAEMKKANMDRATTIMRQDRKSLYVVYPGLKSYADIALPENALITPGHEPKVIKTVQGKEMINGHACIKSKVTLTNQQGVQEEMSVWEAEDLKLPIQVKMTDKDRRVVTIQFKQVEMSKPASRDFEPPEGFARYTDMNAMILAKLGGGKK